MRNSLSFFSGLGGVFGSILRTPGVRREEERVKERPGWLMFPNSLAMAGGVPLFFDGECVGGVGVSGIADDDEKVAEAAALPTS